MLFDTPGEPFQIARNRSGGVAELVFIAGLFVLAARELAAIVGRRGEREEGDRLLDAVNAMAATIAEHGWDGAWFRRAYDFFGNPVGSSVCDEGQIFVESQGMCVMAGVGIDDGRARQALDSVRERLLTDHGVVLQQPAYSGYRIELGEISSYPPGYKENAGIFCHTNPWIMIAEAMTGDGDGAFEVYRRTNPSVREAISEVHRCEPYVYAQMIAGHDAPTHGEAKNSWLTGAAAWNYVAITQWILGIRPEREGLRIDPVIPAAWPGFTATRRFRGSTFRITVRKPEGTTGRVCHLVVDGTPVEGNLVPLGAAGATVDVDAVISGQAAPARRVSSRFVRIGDLPPGQRTGPRPAYSPPCRVTGADPSAPISATSRGAAAGRHDLDQAEHQRIRRSHRPPGWRRR